jgi:hypothetical protein
MQQQSQQQSCSWLASLASGFVGALTLPAIHEGARRLVPHPPRMDTLGRRAVKKTLHATGHDTRRRAEVQRWALLGDIAANTVYYAAVARGAGRARWARALALGTAAGLGVMAAPPYLGLGRPPNNQSASTQAMTIAWYLAGAMASAVAANYMAPRRRSAAA